MRNLCFLFAILIVSHFSNAQTFYVSLKGNDQNIGSIEKPFASLEKAKEAVKKLKAMIIPLQFI